MATDNLVGRRRALVPLRRPSSLRDGTLDWTACCAPACRLGELRATSPRTPVLARELAASGRSLPGSSFDDQRGYVVLLRRRLTLDQTDDQIKEFTEAHALFVRRHRRLA